MAQTVFGVDFIQQAAQYWYERAPFTSTNSIPPGGQASIIGQVSGWNGNFAKNVVFADSIASTQDPNVLYRLVYDGQTRYIYADTLASDLLPVQLGAGLYQNVSLTAVSASAGAPTTVNTQTVITMAVWEAPVSYKIMRGFPLTQNELAIAKAVGLKTNPVSEHGTFPIPISAVIERTYENRLIRTTLEFAGPDPVSTTSGTPFYAVSAQPNEMLIVRSIGAEVDSDYNPTLTVARDNQPTHLQIDPSLLSLDHPTEMFIPATQSLSFSLSATGLGSATPVRIEVWHVARSSIINTRRGIATGDFGLEALQGHSTSRGRRQMASAGWPTTARRTGGAYSPTLGPDTPACSFARHTPSGGGGHEGKRRTLSRRDPAGGQHGRLRRISSGGPEKARLQPRHDRPQDTIRLAQKVRLRPGVAGGLEGPHDVKGAVRHRHVPVVGAKEPGTTDALFPRPAIGLGYLLWHDRDAHDAGLARPGEPPSGSADPARPLGRGRLLSHGEGHARPGTGPCGLGAGLGHAEAPDAGRVARQPGAGGLLARA